MYPSSNSFIKTVQEKVLNKQIDTNNMFSKDVQNKLQGYEETTNIEAQNRAKIANIESSLNNMYVILKGYKIGSGKYPTCNDFQKLFDFDMSTNSNVAGSTGDCIIFSRQSSDIYQSGRYSYSENCARVSFTKPGMQTYLLVDVNAKQDVLDSDVPANCN
ncbi:hypothetical protein COV24_01665 [candidate division WWE3 bacterium CG10_big_fil_rev_8_21_14_0_10_32_10]|uniref:Uncharacterized protein n=1 Tax=candidate division WWE3 bacterium CG10_big_fil_rev_8_21_14_0_10_32_10 TaxID=1975090 RepID=A0A2H0RC76_UNCKA|nr:MAG: hypothetical protein COV24_01665 [candidate division WWE3 bacterium CG10_big_fil_rev_8_21_14_0_10_32_10]